MIEPITINDLLDCGYDKVINLCEPNVEEYLQVLARAANDTCNKDEISKSHSLRLLSAICSLKLRSSDSKIPFVPRIVLPDGTTSFKPTDLPKELSAVLIDFASQVQYPELAARLADVSWVIKQNINAAKTAIANYIKASNSSLCQKHWYEKINRLERGLRLALQIKDKLSIDIIKNELILLFEPSYEFFSYIATRQISSLLLEFELIEFNVLGEKIFSLIELKGGAYEFQHDLLSIAARAFTKGKNPIKANNSKIECAELLVKKAKQSGKMIAASHWYSQAIAAFQQCENQQHRVVDLQKEVVMVNKECHKEMQRLSVSSDITDMVNQATSAMQNKTREESIMKFAYLCSPLQRKNLEEITIKLAQSTIFQSTTEKRILNGDGRLIAIIPPLVGSKDEHYELALKWGCYQQAMQHYSLIVHGIIIPAKNELLKSHQIDETLLTEMLGCCSFFPPGRASLWIKGFVFGFYNDFDAALSLLIPQFEHALRKCLEARGAKVWRVELGTKFHSEKSLGDLLNLAEANEFLGDDLQFELQGLLTEKVGFNFRNEYSHGLVCQSEFYSPNAVYLWWLFFHLVIRWSQISL